LRTNERLSGDELAARLARADGPAVQVLDVRDVAEYEAGHIPGSLSLPWHDIDALPDDLDPDAPIASVCASGMRAGIAVGLLERAGAAEVIHVAPGGVADVLRTPAATGSR
jgi:hydroxyacylglutathione hydrolase